MFIIWVLIHFWSVILEWYKLPRHNFICMCRFGGGCLHVYVWLNKWINIPDYHSVHVFTCPISNSLDSPFMISLKLTSVMQKLHKELQVPQRGFFFLVFGLEETFLFYAYISTWIKMVKIVSQLHFSTFKIVYFTINKFSV